MLSNPNETSDDELSEGIQTRTKKDLSNIRLSPSSQSDAGNIPSNGSVASSLSTLSMQSRVSLKDELVSRRQAKLSRVHAEIAQGFKRG